MIPRVDYNRKRGHLRSHDGNKVQKTRRRLPQKLFDAQAIRYSILFFIVSILFFIVSNSQELRIYSAVVEL